ncbi:MULTISPECIES: ABC transporter ATP-binding protein [Rhizobium/Agrobacterium group]|jgi:multiple sugar transport system ATP-binding protein|uniref:Sn-glycerol-3-phosphate ABC transporter ATP-binding protein UgpC n=2 Tax=Rhizobium/Agrobacterium group TaxID=227290 RepID=A0A1B9TUG5_AGRTU|nr:MULTISPECIES: sn-glycerol-3-phosphate ABC transporter ATP-binding protein UgpC [Rhizobium/Agrobacterium group]EHJ99850.1 sugar ABC transporter nucleotide binding/ATPase protein [Agrobacterium tumefaciens 5A]MDP9561751.1 multiple sugar transport system ATP-binding protein [Rhizobium nepotum]ADY66394.1 sugar ABC transporter, nucleotide binding/ATPase protein [Agrobacterium tumefaciens]AYM12635.1 multiple sugar transport system ATP-binding protein [Agrobacterium tumefaciens]KQY44903.1 ABC tran
MASVELRDIRKSYASLDVIHGISLDITDGEFIALVGPSGCGKSTLLRMIAGLEEITDGDILIGGTVVNSMTPRERNIAMVFQSYALYPHMTVAENMGFNLKLAGQPKNVIDERVAEAARMLDLGKLLDRKPSQLSGGQRQRVAMGRAVVRNPAVFLFDEPLSNLDAKLRVQMRSEIKALHQKVGTTSIYVTHDQIEAMTLADRVVVLNHGRIEQQGTPLELYKTPANLFVAAFIGSPAMNLIEGVVDGEGDQPAARLKDGTAIRIAASRNVKRGQSVTIGLRPEHIGSTVGGDISLSGRTVLVEPTGAQTHVVFELAGDQVTAVVDGEQLVKVNTPFAATVHHERVHVFDRASGLAL